MELAVNTKTSVAIVGGGLSGLISAIILSRKGMKVTLFEKKKYPFHRVCGEYISNEARSFLTSLELYPEHLNPPEISRFQLTSINGKSAFLPLDLGGFGISRYAFDHWLAQKAQSCGVNVLENTSVERMTFENGFFHIETSSGSFEADIAIGAHGKRSTLDAHLDRSFMKSRSPYVGIKYHIKIDHPRNLIALHNFRDGYCGISQIENGQTNLCYLTHRENLKQAGTIRELEKEILFKNPFLKEIFSNAEFLLEQPIVINEISFASKAPVENHIFMIGDAAGMITPLCGNGMAIAIHSAKILGEHLQKFSAGEIDRRQLELLYARNWKSLFSRRLKIGRTIQHLFGAEWTSNFSVWLANNLTPLASLLVKSTHGKTF